MLWDDTEKTKHFSIYFGIEVHSVNAIILSCLLEISLQCFDAVGWAAGRASGL